MVANGVGTIGCGELEGTTAFGDEVDAGATPMTMSRISISSIVYETYHKFNIRVGAPVIVVQMVVQPQVGSGAAPVVNKPLSTWKAS